MSKRSRGNGEGTIYQRKSDGKWCASLMLEGGKRKVLYGKTRQEVARKLRDAQQNRDQGLPPVTDRQAFGVFLDRWLAEVVRPSLRPRTFESYADLVRLHIKPGLGRIQLAKLDAPTILAFLNERRCDGNLRRAGGQPVLQLMDAPFSERGEHEAWQRESPPRFVGLELPKLEDTSHTLELHADRDYAAVQVDVFPSEPEQLTLAHARAQRHGDQRPQPAALNHAEQRPGLLRC